MRIRSKTTAEQARASYRQWVKLRDLIFEALHIPELVEWLERR